MEHKRPEPPARELARTLCVLCGVDPNEVSEITFSFDCDHDVAVLHYKMGKSIGLNSERGQEVVKLFHAMDWRPTDG